MSARHIYNAGNGDISDCRQFFLYAFSGQDRSICNRDKSDMRARAEGGIHSNDKWIFLVGLDIIQSFADVKRMDGC